MERSSTPRREHRQRTDEIRRSAPRDRLAAATTSAIAFTGVFRPVPDCTHVMAMTRVAGVIARRTESMTSSAVAVAASRYMSMCLT